MKKLLLLLSLFAAPTFAQWTPCVGPVARLSFVAVTQPGDPNPGVMFVTSNQNPTSSPPGGIWKTAPGNTCPSSVGEWASVDSTRTGGISIHSVTRELYLDNANGQSTNWSPVRRLIGNNSVTNTAAVPNGYGCAADTIVFCLDRQGNLFSSADNFQTAISSSGSGGITGLSITPNHWIWAMKDSVSSSVSKDGGHTWLDVGSCGGACTKVVNMPDGTYGACDGENNANFRIWNGSTLWNQLLGGSAGAFPGVTGFFVCTGIIYVGSDLWAVGTDSNLNNPVIQKLPAGSNKWVNMTGTGLPNNCGTGTTVKCEPRDLFYDSTSGKLTITIHGPGAPNSLYQLALGVTSPTGSTISITGVH